MGKSKKKTPVEEQEREEEEEEAVAAENEGDDEENGEAGENDDEDEDEDEGSSSGKKLSPEEREANRRARRRLMAKKRGYRRQSSKAGYAFKRAAGFGSSRDVAANIVSIPETIRACKWAPEMPGRPAFGTLAEFRERSTLRKEALPPGPAAVYRAALEVVLRRVVDEATMRSVEMGKPRVTTATLHSVLRPFRSVLRFSFANPQGLLRHAQNVVIRSSRKGNVNALAFGEDDEAACLEEAAMLPKQEAIANEVSAEIEKRRAARAAAKKERAAAA
jgi:hypothetical protein